ncbi:MAG TPA: class I fructose-bisphosphate aldolase [Candidatus Paceibacterota bacterium]
MEVHEIISKLFAPGKGILAADESNESAGKRLAAVGAESTTETRRAYRELFFECPGLSEFISGVILYDETWWERSSTDEPYPAYLAAQGVLPGIKVDQGLSPFGEGEKVTDGLENLGERLDGYAKTGATFAKWRATFRVDPLRELPTTACFLENAKRMAEYAKACAVRGIVPICEPEVLLEGRHSMAEAEKAIGEALDALFEALAAAGVPFGSVILKTSMALPGIAADEVEPIREVAASTARVLTAHAPGALAGVVFLSGGQTPQLATAHLDAIAKREPLPWPVTFSYARAIQEEPLKVWRGRPENVDRARAAFIRRLTLLAAADQGRYDAAAER